VYNHAMRSIVAPAVIALSTVLAACPGDVVDDTGEGEGEGEEGEGEEGEGEEGEGEEGEGEGENVDACAALDEAACVGPDCAPLRGGPFDEYCVDESSFNTIYAGCIDADVGCAEVETCGQEPFGRQRLWFPSSCLPEGWTPCSCDVPAQCTVGDAEPLGQICVAGAGASATRVEVGDRVRVRSTVEGCFGSGCVITHESACAITAAAPDALTVDAAFCIGPSGEPACLPDCGGAGVASCLSDALVAGTVTVTAGALTVSFDVPGDLPLGGECDGDPFSP